MKKGKATAALLAFAIMLPALLTSAFAESAGNAALAVICGARSINVTNGSSALLEITVRNTGSERIMGINPQTKLPYKWMIEEVTPAELTLKPGESGSFALRLSVPASQNASTHTITVTCSGGAAKSNELTVPVTVSANIQSLWLNLGMIAAMSVFSLLYFKKHGRR